MTEMSDTLAERVRNAIGGKGVKLVKGQYHKFMLIPLIERRTRYFDAGPVCIAVEARSLGSSRETMVRGPSIHVLRADRGEEYLRFDMFGGELHYHYVLNKLQHNVVWGYDEDANGPMLDWAIRTLRDRMPAMLRRAGEEALADCVAREGWDTSVLAAVEQAARETGRETDDDMERAREGIEWLLRWKDVHPQFNTVDD